MASLAESFVQQALSNPGPDLAGNYAKGAQLAQQQQDLDLKKQQHQLQLQQLEMAKQEKLVNLYTTYSKLPEGPTKKAFGTKVIPANLNLMGMSQDMNPAVADMLGSDPELGVFLSSKAAEGKTTGAQIMGAAKDAEQFTKLATDLGFATWADQKLLAGTAEKYSPQIMAAEEKARDRVNAQKVASARGNYTVNPDKQLADFGTAVANPSSRSELGQAKQMVNAADAIKQLTDAGLPPNATKAQRVAAYNKLNSQQNAEIVRGMDRLLSRANPTVHGMETLEVRSWADLAAKYGQRVLNTPLGAQQGEFIDNMMGTVNRERDLNAEKFKTGAQSLKNSKVRAANVHSDRMDTIIENAIKPPTPSTSEGAIYRGKDAAWLKSFIQDHPNDPETPNIKAALKKAGVQ